MQHTRKDCAVTDQRQHLKMKLIIVLSVLCVLVNCRPQFQFPGKIYVRNFISTASLKLYIYEDCYIILQISQESV